MEVVQGDFNDVSSLEKAFEGAYGVFCVTNFWDHMNADTEHQQIANMAEACKSQDVKHVVWSTLEDTRPALSETVTALQGDYTVPHFDAKVVGNSEFESRGVPTTCLYTTFYMENFIHFFPPRKEEDGTYSLTLNLG